MIGELTDSAPAPVVHWRDRLQFRLLLVLALSVALPAAGIALFATELVTRSVVRLASEERQFALAQRVAQVDKRLQQPVVDLFYLAQQPELQRLGTQVRATEAQRAQAAANLRGFLGRWAAVYRGALLLGPDAQVWAAAGSQVDAAGGLNAEQLRQLHTGAISQLGIPGQQSAYVGQRVSQGPDTGAIPFALALPSSTGGPGAVLVLKLDIAHTLRNVGSGSAQADRTWVADADGQLLWPQRPAGSLAPSTLQALRPNDTDLILRQSVGTLFKSRDRPDHLQVFSRIRPSGQSAIVWTVVDEFPAEVLLAGVADSRHAIVVLTLGAVIAALLAALPFTRRIVRPLNELSDAAGAMAAGNYVKPLPALQRHDEITMLAGAFDGMRSRVRDLVADLQQRVDDLELSQRMVEQRDQRIRQLVDHSPVGVAFLDLAGGRIAEANDAYLRLVGGPEAPPRPGPLSATQANLLMQQRAMEPVMATLRSGAQTEPCEVELTRDDGSRLLVLVAATLLDGDPTTAVAFVLDLSERQHAQAEHVARVAAESASRAKSTFLAHMSHELRTPLNGILGFAQLLNLRGGLSAEQRRSVDSIELAGRQLLALIEQVLDLARIEAGRVPLQVKRTDLVGLGSEIVEQSRPLAMAKGLRLQLDVTPGACRSIDVDPVRLRQVLANLVSNAVKFTDSGNVTLALRTGATAGRVRFSVIDTGIGIAPADQERIFGAFEQAGNPERRTEGLGLGLAISCDLVRLMGGSLALTSAPNQGSTFSFELDGGSHDRTTEETQSVEPGPGAQRPVLVVDDVAHNRLLLRELLAPLGYDVIEAADGREALAAANRPLHAVLMDIRMPGMDGLEATRMLRADPRHAQTLIAAVSAGASNCERDAALQAGATAFFAKPVALKDLLQFIEHR